MSYSEERNQLLSNIQSAIKAGTYNLVVMEYMEKFVHCFDVISHRDFIFHIEELYV